ncbi:M20 family metallopeptidase [Paraburkholderia sp. Ac-20336]|uniref:M20 family metallopeptidase n=1 Tax=Burkholderiaceae TaxID=119060 RepID=UPI0014238DF9|nr:MULTISPECIES: M20 family metallopeptidase [Burkholderiaceae]MBN3802122.1 M20 family metallopeptidase [Paraburkholderia sp. Ac-20336]MBN3851436.1 M20 family metallopeptidase [Paraburkholderia sp. Ac-20342]NIF54941.1 M20 family metallopeptidase [Burkholderia sp. Ax-1724]
MNLLCQPTRLDALLDDIGAWVRHESPSGDAAAVELLQRNIAMHAQRAGLATRWIPLPSASAAPVLVVSSRAPGDTRAGILVLTHVDTVHPHGTLERNPYRIDGDRVYGPGGYDMKAGAYLALRALATVAHQRRARLPVDMLFIPDEEASSLQSRPVTTGFAQHARYALVCEPARSGGRCVTSRKGVGRARLKVTGRAAHAGIDHERGRNAIVEMARHVAVLSNLTDYSVGTTLNVGTIEGGTGANVVAEECAIRVDFRVASMAEAERMLAALRGQRASSGDFTLDVDVQLTRPPYEKSAATAALLQIAQQHARAAGFDLLDVPQTGGASDGNFTAALGVPTLDGLGVDGAGAHTLNEYFLASSVLPRLDFWTRLLAALE